MSPSLPLGVIAVESACLVVPLRDRTTCCGHITIVSGELLGIPVISTISEATREYTEDVVALRPGDVERSAGLIRNHFDQAPELKAAGCGARALEACLNMTGKRWQTAVQQSLSRYL